MPKPAPKSPVPVMVLSWLIPGFGFMRNGRMARGLYFFGILQFTFLIGAWLRGSVLMPEFNPRVEGFNLVTILTFITQMFNGGLSLISLLPEIFGPGAALLPYDEAHLWADLGTFFLLVSGGMSYFVLASTWDHFYAPGANQQRRAAGGRGASRENPERAKPDPASSKLS